MSDYLEPFNEHLRGIDRSEHTVEAYAGDVAAFFAWLAERLGRGGRAARGDRLRREEVPGAPARPGAQARRHQPAAGQPAHVLQLGD